MLKRILIDLRDFCYHYAKREGGEALAESEYIFKMIGALFLYYFGFVIFITIFVRHFYSIQDNPELSLLLRFVIGVMLFGIPAWLLVKQILIFIKSTPIPKDLSQDEYTRKKIVAISIYLAGIVFFLASFILPTYLIGGT
ncbi:hypothetical protein [Dyadobacter alkalitolerans]|uniref:hypothetical protein n=1 Tax=Dyadobacter alkalitolerans TaxID=492736 RepID=UPI00047DFE86|nr:hypothetical protein [Dyadobacter alkalitolerans]